ncbi:MAG: anti-sigma factor antagonist [Candidatus Hydrogenedentota bacterium]|nr:MAG: anti-sigma factor antagonist [Candidatus Hydrogenedentota bacterium]
MAQSELTIRQGEKGKFVILQLQGKVDSETSPKLTEALNKLISAGKVWIVLDMTGVSFMSSAGIGATVKALNDTRSKKGDLRLAAVQDEVKKVYELLGFAAAFSFYPSLKQALEA